MIRPLACVVVTLALAGCGSPLTNTTAPGPEGPNPPAPADDGPKLADLAKKFDATQSTDGKFAGKTFPGVTFAFKATAPPDAAALAELAKGLSALKGPILLDLRACKPLTPDGLAPILQAKGVTGLVLKGEGMKGLLPTVGRATHLQYLQVSDDSLADADLAPLAPLVNLRRLELYSAPRGFTPAAYPHFAGMTELEALPDSARPAHHDITDADLAHLSGLSKLTELEVRSAPDRPVTDKGMVHLKGMTGLQSLVVRLTPRMTAESLAVVGGLKNLNRLDLYGAEHEWARPGVDELLPLAGRLTVFRFNVSGFQKLDPQPSATWPAIVAAFIHLETLELTGVGLTDKQVALFARLTDLRTLALNDNPLTGVGLAGLKTLSKLEEVRVQHTAVADGDVGGVKDLPPSVKTIYIHGTKLTPAVLDDLEKSRKWMNYFR